MNNKVPLVCIVLACGLWSCGQGSRSQQGSHNDGSGGATAAKPAALAAKPTPAPAPPSTEPPPADAPEPSPYTRIEERTRPAGWSAVSMVNQVPICAFSGYREWEKAQFVQQVKKQRLRAKSVLRFGAYAPWCVNETCDQIPSLECVAEVAGDTITVRTRYYGDHKDGSHCTEECRPITAACDTPELAAGTYQIKYGDRSFSVRLPSVLRAPCFGTDKAPTATKPSARGAAARP